jgi:RNA polymerase sigma factor (sigma-70 family)
MNAPHSPPRKSDDSQLLSHVQSFLIHRERGMPATEQQEAAWSAAYQSYSDKIRKYAFSCGTTESEIADCLQEVWTELLVRLPSFRLDPNRGEFDSWLFRIVRGKAADIRRHKRRLPQAISDVLQETPETVEICSDPARDLEEKEMLTVAWHRARSRLSECSFRILQMRLLERRPVREVAKELGLSHERVWYRFHRANREFESIRSDLAIGRWMPRDQSLLNSETNKNSQEFAQGKADHSVSRNSIADFLAREGGNCVDLVFQRLELGRRDLMSEWKVEWDCSGAPRSSLYARKIAVVAHAEMCGPADFINAHWPRIVNAAIAAGAATGIATIVATPSAALPIFHTEFHRRLDTNGSGAAKESIQVALSANPEPNGPWYKCNT